MQLKQDLIRNLVKTEQSLQGANAVAGEKISQLEREIESMRSERDRTSSAGGGCSSARCVTFITLRCSFSLK